MLKKCGKGKATFGITVDHSFSNCPKITLAVENYIIQRKNYSFLEYFSTTFQVLLPFV